LEKGVTSKREKYTLSVAFNQLLQIANLLERRKGKKKHKRIINEGYKTIVPVEGDSVVVFGVYCQGI